MYGGIPVCEEHLVGSGVLRTRSTVRNAGRFILYDPPPSRGSRASCHPPSTHHPPTTHRPTPHTSTRAMEQNVPTNPQLQYISTAVRTTAVHLWYARSWVGFALSYDSPPFGGEREPSRERLFTPPARGVGTRRPLCRRGHRGLMCGAGGKLSKM